MRLEHLPVFSYSDRMLGEGMIAMPYNLDDSPGRTLKEHRREFVWLLPLSRYLGVNKPPV